MKNYIKKESFYAISRLIFECAEGGISRREIAERCRFSPMTVGKVVAILEQKGLVAQIRAEHSKGRHAMLAIPSEKIAYLFLNVSDTEWTAHLADFKGECTLRQSSPTDPTVSHKDNVERILRAILCSEEAKSRTVFAALINDLSQKEDSSFSSLPSGCSYLLTADRADLVKSRVSRQLRRYNSIYVGFSQKECTLRLFRKSSPLASVSFGIDTLDGNFEEYISARSKELSSSVGVAPDTLIIESGVLSTALSSALHERIAAALKEALPSIRRSYEYADTGFANGEALLILKKQTAHTVTDMFYNGNE